MVSKAGKNSFGWADPTRILASEMDVHTQEEGSRSETPGGGGLAAKAASALAAKAAGTATAFALQIALARWLGQQGFGTYILAFTWTGVLVLLAKQGLDSAALRYLPTFRTDAAGNSELRTHTFLGSSRRRVLLLGSGLSLLGLVVLGLLGSRLDSATRLAFVPLLLAVPILALGQLESGILQAAGRIALSQFPLLVALPTLALVAVLLAWRSAAVGPSPAIAGGIYFGAGLLVLGFLVRSRRRVFPRSPRPNTNTEAQESKPWFPVGRSLLLSAGFGLVLVQADVLMLGGILGSTATGPYAAAARLARFLALPLLAGNAVLAPRIAALHASGRRAELQHLVRRSSLAMAAITLPLVLGLAWLAGPVLSLFGPGFTQARLPLLILLGGQSVNVLMGSVGFLMTMTGGHTAAARILGGCALLNLAANAFLIPRYGPIGAAWATAVTTAIWNITMYAHVRARLRIQPSFF